MLPLPEVKHKNQQQDFFYFLNLPQSATLLKKNISFLPTNKRPFFNILRLTHTEANISFCWIVLTVQVAWVNQTPIFWPKSYCWCSIKMNKNYKKKTSSCHILLIDVKILEQTMKVCWFIILHLSHPIPRPRPLLLVLRHWFHAALY